MPQPTTLQEVFLFYHEFVKPLYSEVQLTNELPVEVLFELNAAWDHVSRLWAYEEAEAKVAEKAFSHLKRSCLDIFKLRVKEAMDQWHELRGTDTSIIDNGDFDRQLLALVAQIKSGAKDARRSEGDSRREGDHDVPAFELWTPVYAKCIELEKNFYENPKVNWARKKQNHSKRKERTIGFVLGVLASLAAALIIYVVTCIHASCRGTRAARSRFLCQPMSIVAHPLSSAPEPTRAG